MEVLIVVRVSGTANRAVVGADFSSNCMPGSYFFAFHDGTEIGPRMLSRIAKHTGLLPSDL